MTLPRDDITGLVLAGGLGSRMGGRAKGLVAFAGEALAARALRRLAPQVGPLLLNANRDTAAHAAFGVPVIADPVAGHPGPLAGLLAGLQACRTGWLLAVPCDLPFFPADLARRLADAAAGANADIAIARAPDGTAGDPTLRDQPVACLLRAGLRDDLARHLDAGGRKVLAWQTAHRLARAHFDRPGDDPLAFANANTLDELHALARQRRTEPPP